MSYSRVLAKNFRHCYKRWTCFHKHYCSHFSTCLESKYNTRSNILGYSVKQVETIPELNLTAIHLEHEATGADHLHLACDDTDNLFCVSLKTIPQNSTGVPHILEHLALCGSRKFPCRDPFFNMLNRSLATFMNAFTGSDSTMYVFSTQNSKDFQNLLSVYLDAVFRPLLQEKDFRQEGWRLEHENINDKNSPIIFKGVVFNEMKGVFSDPNQYYAQHLQNLLLPSNTYSFVSGGDPLTIPTLTWEELQKFHSKYYHPSNSRFLTYGNLPLETHLEQIENSILNDFQKVSNENIIPDEKPWTKLKEVHIHNRFDPMAAVSEKQTTVSTSFLLERITNTYENFALSILGNLLIDGPNSPFYQKLLESGIGPDYSPCTGFDNQLKQSIFSVGVREISEKDVNQVKEIIESTFDDVINTGFPDERIKGILHNVELATKHRTSNFGLSCAMGVNAVWNHSGNPVFAFRINDHVKWFLDQMNDNRHFLQDKVVQYFKLNNHKLTLIMSPDENFEAEQQAKEKKLLESKLIGLTDDKKLQIYNEGIELAKHQQRVDASCLPSLQIEDVKRHVEKTPLKFTSINGVNVQICEQPTNELVYFNAIVDITSVSEEYIMLLPLFCTIMTQMGAGNRNYKQLDQEIQLKSGGFDVSVHLSESPSFLKNFDKGILFSSYCLEKNVSDMFSLWKDIFTQIHLEDQDRLSQLIRLTATDLAQDIPYKGHVYSMRKASSSLSDCAAIRENTCGLSQISYMKKLAEMENHEEVLEKLKHLSNFLLQNMSVRCSINVTASGLEKSLYSLATFLNALPSNSAFESTVEVSSDSVSNQKTHFILPFSVNYIGQSILTVPYCHEDFASLKIAAKLMSSKFLHREIREKGGAYGGGAALTKGGQFLFFSYRDPNMSKTLNSFCDGINWLLEGNYSTQDINEAKLGVFGEVDAPVPPGSKGSLLFKEGISDDMKSKLREHVFKCRKEDLISISQRYLKNPSKIGIAVIGPESEVTKDHSSGWTCFAE